MQTTLLTKKMLIEELDDHSFMDTDYLVEVCIDGVFHPIVKITHDSDIMYDGNSLQNVPEGHGVLFFKKV
jgi:hypothetical protein